MLLWGWLGVVARFNWSERRQARAREACFPPLMSGHETLLKKQAKRLTQERNIPLGAFTVIINPKTIYPQHRLHDFYTYKMDTF